MTATRTIPAIAAALAIALGAVACSPSEGPTPSDSANPSPSDSASPSGDERDVLEPPTFDVPATPEQAVADAGDAAEAWTVATENVLLAGGEGVDALGGFARDTALNDTLSLVDAVRFDGATVSGTFSYEATGGTASELTRPDGTVVSSGAVEVIGCADYQDFVLQGRAGDPAAWPNGGLFEIRYLLEFEDDGRWVVTTETATGYPC